MTLPRCPPPVKTWDGSSENNSAYYNSNNVSASTNNAASGSGGGGEEDDEEQMTLESDLELLGRTVHAVSSALTEPPKENDRFMIYDVSFNPKGCVWDALIVVQLQSDEGEEEDGSQSSRRSTSSRRSKGGHTTTSNSSSRGRRERSNSRDTTKSRGKSRSSSRSSTGSTNRRTTTTTTPKNRSSSRGRHHHHHGKDNNNNTFSFPIRVTCAEDDIHTSSNDSIQQQIHHRRGQGPHPKRAKTYAVDLAVIDDMPHHPISSWSTTEAAGYRDDMKSAMEWVSYGIRRSMARSMFPEFPEGCQGRPFREVYQLNKKVSFCVFVGGRGCL